MSDVYGIPLPDLDEGEIVVDAIILVKTMGEAGVKYRELKTPTLHPIEALGMADTYSDTLRMQLMKNARWE